MVLALLLGGCLHAAPLPPDPEVGVMRRPGADPRPILAGNLDHRFDPPARPVAAPAPVRDAADYPVRPRFPSVSGGPVTVRWFSFATGLSPAVIVPYWPRLTLSLALHLAQAPRPRHRVRLTRATGDTYLLPIAGIVGGTQPDPTLAPGDVLTLFAD